MRLSRWELETLLRPRPLALGLVSALGAAAVTAVPTAVLPNPFFIRMTPVRPQDYLFLALASPLIGLIAATYAVRGSAASCEGRAAAGGVLNALAIGCPICNKLIVLLLGVSGALPFGRRCSPSLGSWVSLSCSGPFTSG